MLRAYQQEACESVWPYLFPFCGINPVIVLPTGSGKSWVIAELVRKAVKEWKGRAIVLVHRKELIVQNAEKISVLLPGVDCGIYSAGLRRRDCEHDVIVAGIQSVYGIAHDLGRRHFWIIDEAHLVPQETGGMYRTFLDKLGEYNPKIRGVGLTATPYRTASGPICRPDGIFQKVSYSASVSKLIAGGFLCPLTNKLTAPLYDTSKLTVRAGEFVTHEVEGLFGGDDRKIEMAVNETVYMCRDRRSILAFCAGVLHAEKVAEAIRKKTGEDVEVITGETPSLMRSASIANFAARRLRWLVNVDVLTTGFDAPCVDAIAVYRATDSAGLFAQIAGRGFRVFPGKENCLLLDYGENVARHGPLDAEDYGRKKGGHGEKTGEAPTKACPGCEKEVHAAARVCPSCGFAFPDRELKHGERADAESEVYQQPERPIDWDVKAWEWSRHKKKYKRCGEACDKTRAGEDCEECGATRPPDTLRIDYRVYPAGVTGDLAGETVREWVCLEHEGFARRNAEQWWKAHSISECPATIDEAISLLSQGAAAMPSEIRTLADGRFVRVVDRTVGIMPETWEKSDSWEGDDSNGWANVPSGSEWEPAKTDDEVPF